MREIELPVNVYVQLLASLQPEERGIDPDTHGLVLFTPWSKQLIFKPAEVKEAT